MTLLLATLVLAQAETPPPDFGPWFANLMYLAVTGAAIVGGLAAWKSYREKKEETPQPFVVRTQTDFVTAEAHKQSIDDIKKELLRHAGRRAEIYDTQKEQGAQLAALNEKTELMNAQLVRQDGKIDRILERLPRK